MTQTPFGPVGYLTYKRTYARRLKNTPNSPTEEFPQTIDRIIKACNEQLNVGFSVEEQEELRSIMLNLKGIVAGRFLWQLGTPTVKRLGLPSLQNCAACVVNEPVRPFTWCMDMLMLGCGVGFNIQREYVYEIPAVLPGPKIRAARLDTKDADFIVPDSREGWVELLKRTLEAYFVTGKKFTYSTICIRSKGAVIKGFGGTASGPEELCQGMQWICEVLSKRISKKVRPVDCLDIMNILAHVVVAGNVRRSAQLAIGDCDDMQYLMAKRWDLGPIPNWRSMSNNSVVCNDYDLLPPVFWEGYEGKGEPYGLINLKLSRLVGRLGDYRFPDSFVVAYNPCAEQSLNNYETCCLAELFLPNISSKEELIKVCTYLYRIDKHSLAMQCHHPETEEIVNNNMRMGIGVTGYLMASEEQKSWLSEAYQHLRDYDVSYSAAHNFPISIKLTTVKPSGTLSLLAGVTSGCHPGYSQFYIRRIRVDAASSLADVCRASGYHVEPQLNFDGTVDPNTLVVSFPCKFPQGTVLAKDMTAVEQLKVVKRLQTEWSDNSVSCTVYYKPEELPEIKEYLKNNYNDTIKTVSFLLHSDHGFQQAPYEEITEEEYNKLMVGVVPINSIQEIDENLVDIGADCESGSCPVK